MGAIQTGNGEDPGMSTRLCRDPVANLRTVWWGQEDFFVSLSRKLLCFNHKSLFYFLHVKLSKKKEK